jgi:hypothetical protein
MTLTSEWYKNDEVSFLKPFEPMVNLTLEFQKEGVPIVVSTARPERLRESSLNWLSRNGIFPSRLQMRGNHDNRPDPLVKGDQARKILDTYGSVSLWYDDNGGNGEVIQELGIQFFLVNQSKKSVEQELETSKFRVMKYLRNRRLRRERKDTLSNMSALNSFASSITPQEQEKVAILMVEHLRSRQKSPIVVH